MKFCLPALKKRRPGAMPKFLIVKCICGIFATVTVLRDVSKN